MCVLCGVVTIASACHSSAGAEEGNKMGREREGGLFIFCRRLGPHSHTHTHTQPLGATQLGLSCVRGDTYIHTICK